jgi:hypothetical protein
MDRIGHGKNCSRREEKCPPPGSILIVKAAGE